MGQPGGAAAVTSTPADRAFGAVCDREVWTRLPGSAPDPSWTQGHGSQDLLHPCHGPS